MSNFGKSWDRTATPVQACVAFIDPELKPMIGLNAMQLRNLGLQRTGPAPTVESLQLRVRENEENLPAPTEEYPLIRAVGATESQLSVYNAFGKLFVEGCGVRLSRGAADKLGVKVGDTLTII